MSDATFYNWKSKYGGLEVSEAKRLRALEAENTKLKRLLADAMLDNAALKDLLKKNGDAGCLPRSGVRDLRDQRAAGVPCGRGGTGRACPTVAGGQPMACCGSGSRSWQAAPPVRLSTAFSCCYGATITPFSKKRV
jgi:transposase